MTIGLMMVIVYLLGVITEYKELFTRGHHFVGFTMGIEIHWIWHENMWFCYLWNRPPNYLYNYIDEGHKRIQNSIHPTAT